MEKMSVKLFLQLPPPTQEDDRSSQQRIRDGLPPEYRDARMGTDILRKLYPLCQQARWQLTVTLSRDGEGWRMVNIEPGDTTQYHYGLAADLGSTTVVMELVDLHTGNVLATQTAVNRQVAFGNEILSRIFAAHQDPGVLEQLRLAAVQTLQELMEALKAETGIPTENAGMLTVAGNTTMMHFLLGLDAFSVFMTPYATVSTDPGFFHAPELGLAMNAMVFLLPAKSNYVGGDITAGILALGLHRSEQINVFLDIGTNGELIIGNRDFLVAGAGAAGPALEGEVIRTGMRAAPGAVDGVRIRRDKVELSVIGNTAPKGICGSGIADLLAELYLEDVLDFRGKFNPENSARMELRDGQWAYRYGEALYLYQEDVDNFLATKAAAYTMVEYMMQKVGLSMEDISRFYLAGAFTSHIKVESGVAIGLYPDLPAEQLIPAGNSSLLGARAVLLDAALVEEARRILGNITNLQFGEVGNFVDIMSAAQGLPHTDLRRYPSVARRKAARA